MDEKCLDINHEKTISIALNPPMQHGNLGQDSVICTPQVSINLQYNDFRDQ